MKTSHRSKLQKLYNPKKNLSNRVKPSVDKPKYAKNLKTNASRKVVSKIKSLKDEEDTITLDDLTNRNYNLTHHPEHDSRPFTFIPLTYRELKELSNRLINSINVNTTKTKLDSFNYPIQNKDLKNKGISTLLESNEVGDFATNYRNDLPNHDEFFSTSSTLTFASIINTKRFFTAVSADQEKSFIQNIFEHISELRAPTHLVGNLVERDTTNTAFQHPTSPGKGLFLEENRVGEHNHMDRARVEFILSQMHTETKNPNHDLESVLKAGAKAAITFTLSKMLPPVSATNVTQTLANHKIAVTSPDIKNNHQVRESMKEIFYNLENTPNNTTNATQRGRHFDGYQTASPRSVSPKRL